MVLYGSIPKIALIAALVVGALSAVLFLTLAGSGEAETVRGVNGVRQPDVVSIPEVPEDDAWTMVASYYGRELEGQPTASGEPFDPDDNTAAHKSLPLGTELEVSYEGESVRVTVTDRGPFVEGRDLDLSLAAAQEIGLTGPGEAPVRVTVL